MIYEKRTYTINPLKMADWLALYKSDAYAVQTEHLGKLIGFFFTENWRGQSGRAYLGV
ncbi:NIPSNAP [Kluyvera cryocrescens]|uniref:NIPSNAP n=1 Tax=Kluyvera cryocrescens TaxID=580 RepID=A0A485CYF1_KLUCR|nr:NIPSNAP [Kluyvera cryocrescens]